jgi:hypothetical protein
LVRRALRHPYALGCAWKIKEGCLIIIVSDEVLKKYRASPEMIYRHEIGHCNGWDMAGDEVKLTAKMIVEARDKALTGQREIRLEVCMS